MIKRYRQEQILKLVRSQEIHTQEDLAEKLSRQGIRTTQVTLSRDLHELGLVKTPEGYKEVGLAAARSNGGSPAGAAPPGRGHEPRTLKRIAGEVLRDVRQAQHLLVLKTDPGNAHPLAIALDQESWPEVVGTIAGDDTIMVICPNNKLASTARDKLLELIAP